MTRNDLVAAQRLHFRAKLTSGSFWLRIAAIWGVAAIAFALFITVVSGPSRIVSTLPVFVLVAPPVIIAVFAALYLVAIPRNARRAFEQQKRLSAPFTYTIAADALILTGGSGTARLAWRDVHKVRENDSLLLIYEWSELFRLLPKRCLPADHLQRIHERIRECSRAPEDVDSDAFDELDRLVRAYLNQDLHEFYDSVEAAVSDCVSHGDARQNRDLLRQMDVFQARYRDDPEAEFACRYGFDFEPSLIGQTVPQFFDMVRAIIASESARGTDPALSENLR